MLYKILATDPRLQQINLISFVQKCSSKWEAKLKVWVSFLIILKIWLGRTTLVIVNNDYYFKLCRDFCIDKLVSDAA